MVPRKILTRSGPIELNTARQSHFNAVRTNRVNAVKAQQIQVCNGLGSQEGLIFLFAGQPRERLSYKAAMKLQDQFDDEKRTGAELTQENDKSQYKKCLDSFLQRR
ncbi:hypothetical protein Tco_1114310 [Tanacetum coccineum]|uniref:Uncharacterized protein n=1 Tax=Tanacetum coccineum TaxID=301880 RepID=A0ABQ5IUQ0_9ASTR